MVALLLVGCASWLVHERSVELYDNDVVLDAPGTLSVDWTDGWDVGNYGVISAWGDGEAPDIEWDFDTVLLTDVREAVVFGDRPAAFQWHSASSQGTTVIDLVYGTLHGAGQGTLYVDPVDQDLVLDCTRCNVDFDFQGEPWFIELAGEVTGTVCGAVPQAAPALVAHPDADPFGRCTR